MTPDNPATALYNVLHAVRNSRKSTVQAAWNEVLDCEIPTTEFAQRHAEVVGLFQRILKSIDGMPAGVQRNIYMRYAPAWYSGIVFRGHWDTTNQPPRNIISQENLDQLAGVMQALGDMGTTELTSEAQVKLLDGLAAWKELLGESGISKEVAEQIRAQVAHIEWLLKNVAAFGTEPVVRESRTLVGLGIELLGALPKNATKIAKAVALVASVITSVHVGVDGVAGILEGANAFTAQLEIMSAEPPAEIEGGVVEAEFEEVPPSEADSDQAD